MRFIHTADVHLAAVPDRGSPWSGSREQEIWDTFERLINRVKEQRIPLLLIAGDLFHRQPLLKELKEVAYLFSTIPDTRIVLTAGNHDYLKKDSYYRSFVWEKNVVCLWQEQCQAVYLEEADTWVYGLSYGRREITDGCYDNLRPLPRKGRHILVAHGGDARHIPMDYGKLGSAGFDYIALGHIHKPQIMLDGRMAYAGSLEPLDRTETGPHGFVEGIFQAGGLRVSFVPFSCREYREVTAEVGRKTTQRELEGWIRREIEAQGKDHIYNLKIVGFRDPDIEFDQERLKRLGNVADVEDASSADYDFEALSRQYRGTLIEEYIHEFPVQGRTPVEEQALYFGVKALLESKR